jgi:hypothetical protein
MAYLEQLERVERWLNRIRAPNGVPYKKKDEYEDFLWAFFQNCWHMTDWIEMDPVLPHPWKNVKGDALKVDSLRLTEGLANRTKHFERNDPTKSKSTVIADITVNLGGSGGAFSDGYRVLDEKTKTWVDLLGLAQRAVEDWKALLRSHGLL